MTEKEAYDIAFECLQPLAGKVNQYLIYMAIRNVANVLMKRDNMETFGVEKLICKSCNNYKCELIEHGEGEGYAIKCTVCQMIGPACGDPQTAILFWKKITINEN